MTRVIAYIDGFNLYFGMRSQGWKRYYWLDLCRLATGLLKPGQALEEVHYFTSRIRSDGLNSEDMQRQTVYLEALATRPGIRIHLGHYLEKPRSCRRCGARWVEYEEKMTDVNIAAQLLTDAMDDRFDTALLVSGDSDLTTPVRMTRARFTDKRVVIALPPQRRSHQLQQAASGYFVINETAFRRALLPERVERADGFVLHRPDRWR